MAAVISAACVKTENDGNNVISFAPVASKATRAIIDGTTYPTGESFVVSAYVGTTAYFENHTASYSSTPQLWETSTVEYWPLGGSLTFIAYSPASVGGLSIDATNGVTVSDYTIQSAEAMTTDLLYATYTVADCSAHPASVPLTFSHALSQIVFKVKAADYYSTQGNAISLAMSSLSLSGILSVGDFADGSWDNQETAHTYALRSTPISLTYNNQNAVTADVCAYLFLPQTLAADASLHVGYSITQTISGTDYTVDNPPVSIPLGTTTISEWEPGKKYIYTISIGLDNLIEFTATANEWTAQEGGVVVE
ncbi:MAG: fimbrillin family protein [Bacteroidales bacterium]|nr:fimbrillin family protein [Bacteroidales bacterium]